MSTLVSSAFISSDCNTAVQVDSKALAFNVFNLIEGTTTSVPIQGADQIEGFPLFSIFNMTIHNNLIEYTVKTKSNGRQSFLIELPSNKTEEL